MQGRECHERSSCVRTALSLERCLFAVADEHVSSELKKQIMSARLATKLTQAQLAQVRGCRSFVSLRRVYCSCGFNRHMLRGGPACLRILAGRWAADAVQGLFSRCSAEVVVIYATSEQHLDAPRR